MILIVSSIVGGVNEENSIVNISVQMIGQSKGRSQLVMNTFLIKIADTDIFQMTLKFSSFTVPSVISVERFFGRFHSKNYADLHVTLCKCLHNVCNVCRCLQTVCSIFIN